tara:strand:+ start:378 stop:767 length:390 start_codon:yes stop_codon:yes gene_type:complete
MATVATVTLDLPSSDPNIDVGQTFAMQGDVADALHGGMDYDMKWQYDQGTATWIDIPSSGSELSVPANPILNHGTKGVTSKTVTGEGAGTYDVRIQTIDNNDGSAVDTSGTQTVTVNAAAGGSRRVLVS